jgi:hypothetical protein
MMQAKKSNSQADFFRCKTRLLLLQNMAKKEEGRLTVVYHAADMAEFRCCCDGRYLFALAESRGVVRCGMASIRSWRAGRGRGLRFACRGLTLSIVGRLGWKDLRRHYLGAKKD